MMLMRPGTGLRWVALKHILLSEIKKNSSIIDVGGYNGAIAQKLQKEIPKLRVIVLDKDNSGLISAKRGGLDTIRASVLKLPIGVKSYDLVLCFDLIEHINADERLIEEISRILKDDGRIILTTPMQNGVNFPFLPKKYTELINKKWGHVRKGYSIEKLKEMFQKYNLLIVKKGKYFNYLTKFFYWFRYLSNFSLKLGDFLFRVIIKLEPYLKFKAEEHVIIAKRIR